MDFNLYSFAIQKTPSSYLPQVQNKNDQSRTFLLKELKMNDFEEFVDTIKEATEQLVFDIETAWQELKEDLHETVTVKYLRPGGIAYCKSEGRKYYGILTGTEIISLNTDGEPEYMKLQDFLDLHEADKLKVATQKRIAVGFNEVDYAARMSVEEEKFPSTKVLVLKCLAVDGAVKVDEAIEEKFGSFEWLSYDIPEETCDTEDDE